MTADFQLEMTLMGEQADIKNMLEVFAHYSNRGDREAYFNFIKLNGKSIDFGDDKIDLENITDEHVVDLSSSGEVKVGASGPYGRYSELNDVGLFREMSEAAPNGRFVAEISGFQQYSEQNLKCRLEEGKLYITTFFQSNVEAGENWKEDFMEKLPLKKFKELFAVSGDDINEESYEDLVEEIGLIFCDEFDGEKVISFVKFDDFVSSIAYFGGKTELNTDQFMGIMENTLSALKIYSPDVYEHIFECGETNEYVYDPVKKSYEGKTKPLFDGTGITDANDILAAGLRAQGLPDDEEALANLSIEEAYAALGAALGAGEDDDEEDDDEE